MIVGERQFNRAGERRTLSTRAWAIVLLYGAVVLGSGLMSGWALTQHEAYAAQPAREMLSDGHWFIPTFGGIPRKVKPPTTGWTIATMMAISRSEAEWVVRLPATLSGVAIAAMVAAMTARQFGERAGVVAGLIQLSSVYILMQARLAEADMMLAACVVGAMVVFAKACVDDRPEVRSMTFASAVFYGFAALSLLYKGPVGPLCIFPACIIFTLWRRHAVLPLVSAERVEVAGNAELANSANGVTADQHLVRTEQEPDRRALQLLRSPFGILVFLLIAAIWPVPALIQDPAIWKVWYSETIGRAQGEMGESERQPFYFYVWNAAWLILPWTHFALVGVALGWRRIREESLRSHPFAQFLICWFFVGLFLLSLSSWKHKHYIIPILPAITPVAAIGAILWIKLAHFHQPRSRSIVWAVIWMFVCIGGGVTLYFRPIIKAAAPASGGVSMLLIALGIGGAAVLVMEYLRQVTAQLVVCFATAAVCIVIFMTAVEPQFDGYRKFADLSARATAYATPGQTIWLIGTGECQAAYYLPMPIRRIEPVNGVLDLTPITQPTIVLTLNRYLPALTTTHDVQILDVGVDIDDPDRSKGKRKDKLIVTRISPRNLQPTPATQAVLLEEME